MAQSTNKSDILEEKNLNKFKTKRGLKRKILWVEVNDEGNDKKQKISFGKISSRKKMPPGKFPRFFQEKIFYHL